MLELAWPWTFLALPLPWLLRWSMPPAPETAGAALRLPFYEALTRLPSGSHLQGNRGRRAQLLVGSVIWILLVLSAARPQWMGDPVDLPLEGRDLMLAVDISGSMEQSDFDLNGRQVTRLDVVKAVASRFIERRHGDRIGLLLFGSRAYLQTPLTFDRKTVQQMLAEAEIGLAGKETAIGDAIGLAVKRLQDTPEQQRILILLTDGANTAGAIEPTQAARLAAEAGLRIYTIGLGADRMRVRSFFGTRTVNPSADLDEATLRQIAELTQGQYFRARDTEALHGIYQALDRLEPRNSDADTFRPVRSLFHWPLGLALILSAFLAAQGLTDRKPRRSASNADLASTAKGTAARRSL